MKKVLSGILFFCFCFFSIQAFSQTRNFEFVAQNNFPSFHFPGLILDGPVQGKVSITRNDFSGPVPPVSDFKINSFMLDFEEAPDLRASGFSFNAPTNSYIAELGNTWVFRRISIQILDLDPSFTQLRYRVSVVTNDDFTGTSTPDPFFPDVILTEGQAELVDITPFRVADRVSIVLNGKRLTLSLNAQTTSNFDPTKGDVGEGVQLKLNWLGFGEKLAFLQQPLPPEIKPIALLIESFPIGGGQTDYLFSVRFRDPFSNTINETPLEPLLPLVERVFAEELSFGPLP